MIDRIAALRRGALRIGVLALVQVRVWQARRWDARGKELRVLAQWERQQAQRMLDEMPPSLFPTRLRKG